MALKNTDPNAEFPYYFMVSQSIHQRTVEFATDPAYYTIAVIWKAYKIEADDRVVFDDNSQYSYYDENFYSSAVAKYMGGNPTDVNTLGAQELSVKEIIESELGITLEVV